MHSYTHYPPYNVWFGHKGCRNDNGNHRPAMRWLYSTEIHIETGRFPMNVLPCDYVFKQPHFWDISFLDTCIKTFHDNVLIIHLHWFSRILGVWFEFFLQLERHRLPHLFLFYPKVDKVLQTTHFWCNRL